MSRARTAGLAGAAVGLLGAGVAVGLAAERALVRRERHGPDAEAGEPLGLLHTAPRTVPADDGVPLRVEVDGDPDAALTVVFVHGFVLTMDSWHYQRRDLRDVARLVFYDQRGHGASGRGPREHATIDQLGRDLGSVLDAVAPRGRVVLVGHSMGGMTVMALAQQRPELLGTRVAGVVFMSTSPGKVAEAVFGIPTLAGRVLRPLGPGLLRGLDRRASLIERGRRSQSDLAYVLVRRYGFGSPVPPAVVDHLARMVASTPFDVMSEFFPTFVDHDKLAVLPAFAAVPTVVLAGEDDLLTPAEHSRAIAAAVPGSELVLLADAGHMVMLERPALVNLHLRAFLRRVGGTRRRRAASA